MASTPTPAMAGRSSAQNFLEEHDQILTENEALKSDIAGLRHDNQVLLSEVNMLREELSRADKDRMLLRSFFSGLLAKKEMIEAGVQILDRAFKEAAKLGLEQVRPVHKPEEPVKASPIEEPSKIVLSTTIPEIEAHLKTALAQIPAVTWQ